MEFSVYFLNMETNDKLISLHWTFPSNFDFYRLNQYATTRRKNRNKNTWHFSYMAVDWMRTHCGMLKSLKISLKKTDHKTCDAIKHWKLLFSPFRSKQKSIQGYHIVQNVSTEKNNTIVSFNWNDDLLVLSVKCTRGYSCIQDGVAAY